MWELLQWTFCTQIFRFEHTCVAYDKALAKYVVNTANLNATIADNTPRWTFSTLHVFFFFTFLHTNTRIWSAWKKFDLLWDYEYKFRLHTNSENKIDQENALPQICLIVFQSFPSSFTFLRNPISDQQHFTKTSTFPICN